MYEQEPWDAFPEDNSTGIHSWTGQLFGDELNWWMDRLVLMKMRNITTLQTDPGFMQAAAARHINVYCRPFYRANDEWGDDGSCVENMLAAGLKARVQIYNEPDLIGTEWGDNPPGDYIWARNTWANRWMAAATYIFNRGGWPGIQTLDLDWFRYLLERIRDEHPEIIKRLWNCVHNYMSNHKPDYIQDNFCFLSPLWFDAISMEVFGIHLPVVCGEGGWCVGDAADNRYPMITEATHAEYTKVSFDMFRTRIMPNGQPLPDWWKAITPWLLSAVRTNNDSAFEQNAWYGAWHPDRQLTIDAVISIPNFVRQYDGQVEPVPVPDPNPGGGTMPEFQFQFKDLHDANPDEIGDALSSQEDILIKNGQVIYAIQRTTKGLLQYVAGTPAFFTAQTLPPL